MPATTRSTRSAAGAMSRASTPGSPARGYLQASTAPTSTRLGPGRRGLRRARRGRADRGPRPRGHPRPLRLAAVPVRRLLPGGRDRPAGPARRRAARADRRGRGRGPRAHPRRRARRARRRRRRDDARRDGPRPLASSSPPAGRCSGSGRCGARSPSPRATWSSPSPFPDLLEELGWTGGECITDSRHMVHYFRTTRDGRIAFGWGGGRIVRGANVHGRAEIDPAADRRGQGRTCCGSSPQLEGREITHAWGGPIDVSPTHLPVIRSVGERSFAGFGYTGHGVGPSQMVGRALAVAGARPPRRVHPPADRRPAAGQRAARAVPLRRRRDHPPRDHPQGDWPRSRTAGRVRSPASSAGSRS